MDKLEATRSNSTLNMNLNHNKDWKSISQVTAAHVSKQFMIISYYFFPEHLRAGKNMKKNVKLIILAIQWNKWDLIVKDYNSGQIKIYQNARLCSIAFCDQPYIWNQKKIPNDILGNNLDMSKTHTKKYMTMNSCISFKNLFELLSINGVKIY